VYNADVIKNGNEIARPPTLKPSENVKPRSGEATIADTPSNTVIVVKMTDRWFGETRKVNKERKAEL
jgi:hypothetical protein